jgi:2-dehydropantoate 2-reductase
MNETRTRILVIGAGVNGSICAASLYRAGFDVAVLARRKRYEELVVEGIVIEDPFKKKRTVTRVPVIRSLDPEDCYEYILVIVRKNQVAALLPILAENRSETVVFMINNPSGPGIYTEALGQERVLLGFAFGGGKRDGSVIRAMSGEGLPGEGTPFGELNGRITPRLTRLIGIFHQAGLHARTSTQMVDYLATHASLVAPLAAALLRHGCDNYDLARSKDDLRLLVEGMREVIPVLRANGFAIVPSSSGFIFGVLPRFLLEAAFRLFLPTRIAEVGAAWHCSQAPDEMVQLGVEVLALVEKSGLPAPALRKLLASPGSA